MTQAMIFSADDGCDVGEDSGAPGNAFNGRASSPLPTPPRGRTTSSRRRMLSASRWRVSKAVARPSVRDWLCPLYVCAVTRRRFPVGASPTQQSLPPEATGAVMAVTKWLKPSVSQVTYSPAFSVCFNVSRTVERAMPRRRAISCVETDENFSRMISRTSRFVIRSAGTDCSFGTAKGAT